MARKRRKDSFVIGVKVREFVRANRCMAGSDLAEALDRQVAALLRSAVGRAKLNKRKTVRGYDL
ncbi:MAG TPA: hypothetical protein PK280_02620 [Planctomycetota bacterium]|nr:hypothetical protein [Planctomycetota bacterium]